MAKKKSGPEDNGEARKMRGATKAAVMLMALDAEVSAKVLRLLKAEVVEEVTREIASMDLVDATQRGGVVEEFYNLALARQYVDKGGLQQAKSLLEKALPAGDADRILKQITSQVFQQPFAFLMKTDADNLLTFIQDEHPQTIALVLAHLSPEKASEILGALPGPKQLEVVSRIAKMEQTNPEVIREVEQGLEQRLAGMLSQTFSKAGGVEAAAGMLNLADRATEKAILEAMETEDPELVEQIRRLMFVFEDILMVNDKGIQSVLKEIDNNDLSLALKTAGEDVREKIFKNMSERAAQLVKEDMEYMGPVRVSDVEAAQQRIVDVIRRLEDAGDLVISGRGAENMVV